MIKKKQMNPRPVVLAAIVVAVGVFRVVTSNVDSPLAGFTPLGAMALFSGFYFRDRWKAYLLPIMTLWLSDIILNRFFYFGYWIFFYESFAWVYASFAVMVWIGQRLKKVSVMNGLIASVAAAGIHFIVANFGVWLAGCTGTPQDNMFTPDLNGLIDCYTLGLPVFRNLLIGNLFFSAVLFGSFELMQRRFPVLQT